MQKVMDILERYVEWIAIGLGALFALWMVYGYVFQTPVTVRVDNQMLGPGEVAHYTQESVAVKLRQRINDRTPISMAILPMAEQFEDAMKWKGTSDQALASIWTPLPANLTEINGQGGGPNIPGPNRGNNLPVRVATRPDLPSPTPEEARVGRSTVQWPGNQQGNGAPATRDIEWVTQSFTIPMDRLNAAFNAANIPKNVPGLYSTCFLRLEMVRQEVDVNGKNVGPAEIVQPLPAAPNGNAILSYPGDNGPQQALSDYLKWAEQNTQQILRPDFYQVVKGDPWVKPGTQPAEQQQQYTLDNPPPGWQNDPRWYSAVMKHRRDLAQQRAEQQRKNAPARPSGTQFPGASPALRDPARPAPPAHVPPMDPPGAEGMPPAVNPAAQAPIPSGDFDPSKFNQPTLVWVHDLSVKPGKIYKYKMRYRIRNPLYGVTNVAKNPQLANVFSLVSPDSAWSKPVAVPAKTNFFVARNVVAGASSVTFQVFRWEDGIQHSSFFNVSPGDTIGATKDGIDYSTDWTLVGMQPDPRTGNVQILLVNKEGTMTTRSSQADQANPLYQKLIDQVNAAKQATANSGGAGQ